MLTDTFPGTEIKYTDTDDIYAIFRPMIDMTGGLSLSQICSITGLHTSTIQNWVKRSYVPHPVNKKYHERQLSRILLISSLKDCMNIEDVGELMVLINGDTDDESDDIISETKLYECFSDTIKYLDDNSLDDASIRKVIKKVLNNYDTVHKDKLILALETMVYAYISGKCIKQANFTLNRLRKM